MKEFRLNTSTIIQLLGDSEFYAKCPAYLFMRDQALAAVEQYNKAVAHKEECNGCTGKYKDENSYVAPAIGNFVRILREMHKADPANAAPIKTFIAERLGYRPPAIVLYYKEGGKERTLRF